VTIRFDSGSFRDPDGHVFRSGPHVFRKVTPAALDRFERLQERGLLTALASHGWLMPTTIESAPAFGLDPDVVGARVLRQDAVALVSYAYEWTFSMLQDAALVTLDTLEAALERDVVLKDAPSFNILFDGTCPRLVDILSLEPYQPGALWAGYTQFCRSFLAPLLITSHTGAAFQPLVRAHLGELPLGEAARLLGWQRTFRRGVATHVLLQSRLEQNFGRRTEEVKRATAPAHYPKSVFLNTVRRMRRLVDSLRAPASSAWTEYADCNTYSGEDRAGKVSFVERVLTETRPAVVIDLGCNTGEYSRLALRSAGHVIAVDGDAGSVDALYRAERGSTRLTPLVSDLHNPTPAQGWELRERASLLARLEGDFLLALALVHHLRISAGIPLDAIVAFLVDRAPAGIIEWVDRQDPMVQQMLRLRPDVYDDYTWSGFEHALRSRAEICALAGADRSTRRLCHYKVRGGASPRP